MLDLFAAAGLLKKPFPNATLSLFVILSLPFAYFLIRWKGRFALANLFCLHSNTTAIQNSHRYLSSISKLVTSASALQLVLHTAKVITQQTDNHCFTAQQLNMY